MMTYQKEFFTVILPEVQPLNELNHQEVPLFGAKLEIDVGCLMQMEEDGIYKVFTMRKNGELVGYCAFVLYHHPHHARLKVGDQDVIFIKKGCRGHASKFVQYCEKELKDMGVHITFQHSPKSKPWGKVLERIGYEELETTYFRRL
jgi:hypothetical protein